MTSPLPLLPRILSIGLSDVIAATKDGLQLEITHVAFGDGGQDGGVGYTPNPSMTGLVRERARVPVAGGTQTAFNEFQVEVLLDVGPNFWMREVAFISQTGRPFAIWSHPDFGVGYKTEGVPLALAYAVSVEALPADSVTVLVTGPNINLTMAEPLVMLATQVINLQARDLANSLARLSPVIENTWYL